MMVAWLAGVSCSNVAYHGELEKKAAMEQKRVMTGEDGEADGDGECQELKNLVQDVKNEKENVWELFSILSSANSLIA